MAVWLAQPLAFHLGRAHAWGSIQPGTAGARSGRRTQSGDPRLPGRGLYGGFQAAAFADEALEGIFCANAQIACGFLDGMRQRGKQAPEDYQLIGFDNTPPTAQYSYQLTTLHQDVAAISRQTLARLQERTVDPLQPSRTTWVEVTLIHRRTSPFII